VAFGGSVGSAKGTLCELELYDELSKALERGGVEAHFVYTPRKNDTTPVERSTSMKALRYLA